ncbi:GTPase IMAP family member 8-like protein [Lates japonicus]|uniref:GTPase IMAP family member 8-like protein n=1 Tax=Lates japonicus TaxID=270547 RepID=A0AAD3NHJ5_LATJO|nr:GTPase IMAP family member 8-like protein [Lates japonicus]
MKQPESTWILLELLGEVCGRWVSLVGCLYGKPQEAVTRGIIQVYLLCDPENIMPSSWSLPQRVPTSFSETGELKTIQNTFSSQSMTTMILFTVSQILQLSTIVGTCNKDRTSKSSVELEGDHLLAGTNSRSQICWTLWKR